MTCPISSGDITTAMTIFTMEFDDGSDLSYCVRRSARAGRVRLTISGREGLVVTAPNKMSQADVERVVCEKKVWIATQLARLKTLVPDDHLFCSRSLPQKVHLPALGAAWSVEYRWAPGKRAVASALGSGQLVVRGRIEDLEVCRAALGRWLIRQARSHLSVKLDHLAREMDLKYQRLSIKDQRTRWGSCSAKGVISLNFKLLFLPPELTRYVLVHELCHRLELNHSPRFWDWVRHFEPAADHLRKAMRRAWVYVPPWL